MTEESIDSKEDLAEEKTALSDHYMPVVKPHLNTSDEFYSYRYFFKKKYFHSKYDEMTATKKALLKVCPRPRITAFTQGSIYFPYEDREEVLSMISFDVMANSTIYWNQIAYDEPGEGCRLVIDIDSDTRVLSNSVVEQLARVLWKTLKAYYPDFDSNPIDIFVAKCGPRIKKGNLSTGVHIIAHVKVSIEEAKQIISGYNLRLKLDTTIDMKGLSIDAGIYKSASKQCSLRMIYCNKVEKCPLCGDKIEKRQGCNFCNKMGEVISKATYEPFSVLDPNTGLHSKEYFLKKNNNDFFQIVKNYSIWPESGDEKHVYVKAPSDPIHTDSILQKRPGQMNLSTKPLKKIRTCDPSYALLEEFIRDIVFDGQKLWDGIGITKIGLTENERMAFVYVSGLGSTNCPYAKKDHGDNRIYFTLTRKGILTCYCHSDKEEYGCKTKERIRFNVPGQVFEKVFGIQGHPSFYKTADVEKNFSFDEFLKRQKTNPNMKVEDEEDSAREKLLKRLSEFYQLGADKLD